MSSVSEMVVVAVAGLSVVPVVPGVFPVDVHVLVVSDRRVLLLREVGPPSGWVLPSAGLGNGESVDDACVRVLTGVLGVRVGLATGVRVVHVQHQRVAGGRLGVFVGAQRFTGVPVVADRTRFDRLEWCEPGALPAAVAAAVAAGVVGWTGRKCFSVFPARSSRRLGVVPGGVAGAGRW